jgi:tetratricopeptide (TPR) repeat protein
MTLLPAIAAWLGCAGGDPASTEPGPAEPPPAAPRPPSLVLVTLDTTRADRIGAYGYGSGSTPEIDALAAEGVRFDAAYTTVPLTIPAHATLFTGRYPPSLGVRVNGDHPLPAEALTLAEILRDSGYTTIASVGAFVTTRVWAFDQGFDVFDDDLGDGDRDRLGLERTGPEVVNGITSALVDAPPDEPVFVWAHLYDPHEPYAAPGIFMSRGLDAYDSEVAYADAQIGRLRKVVERFAGDSGVAYIVVADHGEGLGDDPERGHGIYLYDETLRVPFVISGPGPRHPDAAPAVRESVSVVDVLPTALGMLGIPLPAGLDDLDGVDLSPALKGAPIRRGPVYAESEAPKFRLGWAPEVVAIDEDLQLYATPNGALIDRTRSGRVPSAWADLSSTRPEEAARLRAFVDEVRGRVPIVGDDPEPGLAAAQLEALGYVSSAPSDPAAAPTIDAKDRAEAVRRLDEARHVVRRPGGRAEAERLWRSVLASDPDIVEARLEIVSSLDRSGKRSEALALLNEGVAAVPDAAPLLVNRARLLLSMGRAAEAAADAERVLARDAGDRAAREVLVDATPPETALERIRGWQAEAPDDPFLHAMAGLVLVALERFDEAHPELTAAAAAPAPWLGVHGALGRIERQRGEKETARRHLEAEVEHFPQDPPAWHALAAFQLETLRDAKAASQSYDRVLGMYPADVVARRGLAASLVRLGDLQAASHVLGPLLPTEDPEVMKVQAALLAARGESQEANRVRERAKALTERGG